MNQPAISGVQAVIWQDTAVHLLDQRLLPDCLQTVVCVDAAGVAAAIRDMVVRGAPAIGLAAAYGLALSARQHAADAQQRQRVRADAAVLAAARPTAVNLQWAIDRLLACLQAVPDGGDVAAALTAAAIDLHQRDLADNLRMGQLGAALIEPQSAVLTHCNAGALATAGHGTALGVIRSAWAAGRIDRIYADETRPWLQGARLTAWELLADGLPVTLLADAAAAHLMKQGAVQWVIVGADRIAANGDTANKIGTYGLAVLARQHGVRFMVVAPTSTLDLSLADGSGIPIEQRDPDELLSLAGRRVAAAGAQAWNPSFDVTPAGLIDALVTERGVLQRPDAAGIAGLVAATTLVD